jgi:hypothetical protein
MTKAAMTESDLATELRTSVVDSGLDNKGFLPLSYIDTLITEPQIKLLLHGNLDDSLHVEIFNRARKVFAILVIIEGVNRIQELLAAGLTDEVLPVYREDKVGQALKSTLSRETFELFLQKQWLVQSPVLDATGQHIDLDQNCALPFTHVDHAVKHGGFSTVYKGTLHPAHQRGLRTSPVSISSPT